MTAGTHGSPVAGDGFATYDELTGPELDAAHWGPARIPLPTGEHIPWTPTRTLPSARARCG